MKKTSSFAVLHRVFTVGAFLIIGGLLGFLVYLYFTFNGQLTGNVKVDLATDLLTNLQTQRFDDALDRMKRRQMLPDIPADMPDPFDAPLK